MIHTVIIQIEPIMRNDSCCEACSKVEHEDKLHILKFDNFQQC
jgi:hypothetical protein